VARKAYILYIDLDDKPGPFYTQDSMQNTLNQILSAAIPQFNPLVSLAPDQYQIALNVYGPHSRACGIVSHEHGEKCHSNCPTCWGRKRER
jgi:hypothetical protein